jgi:hypothetical protein
MKSKIQKYKCYKEVTAFKIKEIKGGMGLGYTLIPEDPELKSAHVGHNYIGRHNPKVGGYFVEYADGYQSWSPAAAFESGYELIKES